MTARQGGLFPAKLRFLENPGFRLKRYSISHQGEWIDYRVVHRPRVTRRIHLELDEGGELQVVAPQRMSKRSIQDTLQQRAHHVAHFLARARERRHDMPHLNYVNGERHLFMGRPYSLSIEESDGGKACVELSGGQIRVVTSRGGNKGIQSQLARWYRQQAEYYFREQLNRYCEAAPWTRPDQPVMRLRLMKSTWGSCSRKGVITLNPHLVKAPSRCIDYVIAHEVCHLKELNHGQAFYALQDRLYPDWREAKDHLRVSGHIYLAA